MLYTPLRNAEGKPIASVGLVYTSQAVLPLNGSFFANGTKVADASTTLVLPQIYRGAMAVWPVRDREHEWKLEVDVEYVGWKSVRNFDLHSVQRCRASRNRNSGRLCPSWLSAPNSNG